MGFQDKLSAAAGSLSQYESVAGEIAEVSAAGLATMQMHLASVKGFVSDGLKASAALVEVAKATAQAVERQASSEGAGG